MDNPPPNVEAIVVTALREDAGVTEVVGQRVHGSRPPDAVDPLLVVQRVGGNADGQWIENARIQVDAWGTTRGDAFAGANAAAAALRELSGAFDSGVLSGAERTSGPMWLPDPVTDRPRYIVQFTVYAHPLTGPASS